MAENKTADKDELILLRVAQIERVGSILFFLIPLVILLIFGKTFAFNTLYLWQGLSLLYIVVYRLVVRSFSSPDKQLAMRRRWSFYCICWCYLVVSIAVTVGYFLVSHI